MLLQVFTLNPEVKLHTSTFSTHTGSFYRLLYKHTQPHLNEGKTTQQPHTPLQMALPKILGSMTVGQTYLATSTVNTTQPEIRFPTEQREAAVAR